MQVGSKQHESWRIIWECRFCKKRINKDTFGITLEKMSSRVAGWKGKMLSFAGRLTLTKAVLSSIPIHTMSTILLPKTTITAMDKISRNFLRGITQTQRKQHLIAWKCVCRPKKDGGLGLQKAQNMNKALLAKVGWHLIQDNNSLWARVLRSKYKVGVLQDGSWTNHHGNRSSTW